MTQRSTPNTYSEQRTQTPMNQEARNRSDNGLEFLNQKTSLSSSPLTMHHALRALKKFIENTENNPQIKINTTHPEAKRWLKKAQTLKAQLEDPEVASLFTSRAGYDVDEINSFLKEKGFDIELKQWSQWDIYVASVFKQEVQWKKTWKKAVIDFMETGKEKEAVSLEKGIVSMYKSDWKPIFKIQTNTPWEFVYMQEVWNIHTSVMDLDNKIQQKMNAVQNNHWINAGLIFPKVELNQSWNIEWMLGWKVWSHTISQAMYQNKLSMDEKWAVAESAVALAASKSFSLPHSIKWPFVVWFTKTWENWQENVTFSARIWENEMIAK